jgi:hypothetical protein
MGKSSSRIIGFFNALSGGIFIGIGLFLLLPEAKESFDSYFKGEEHNPWYEMPYSFFLAFATYSFLLFFEKVAFNMNSIIPDDGQPHHHHHHEEEKDGEGDRKEVKEDSEDEDEEVFKNVVSTRGKFASFMQIRECKCGIVILSTEEIVRRATTKGQSVIA